MHKNSLDGLRLVASTMVLLSHQFALSGLPEPSFFGLTSFGTAGVTIFFFLSGFLVWTSWDRDPNLKRFFWRRALRIFPALWVVCLVSVFLLGPAVTALPVSDYFNSAVTWRYLGTLMLLSTNVLPGLFPQNALPFVVNGSLWTLPLEFLCYVTVAVMGLSALYLKLRPGWLLGGSLTVLALLASYGSLWTGDHFVLHFEMVAMFWWGAFYGYCVKARPDRHAMVLPVIGLILFASLGPRGLERTAVLVCAAGLVHVARRCAAGARLTDPLGDLSYGVYIFAFPVQQLVIQLGSARGWSWGVQLAISVALTFMLAYLSWNLVEKWALRFKPHVSRLT